MRVSLRMDFIVEDINILEIMEDKVEGLMIVEDESL